MPGLSDVELAAAIRAGDEQAAAAFDAKFRPRIEALARRAGIPVADCPDVRQEVLSDALRQIAAGRFRGDSALSTWLYRIMKRRIADYWRRHGAQAAVSLTTLPDAENPLALAVTAFDGERIAMVREALSRLTAAEQLVLLLHDREGYTLEELGRLLGLRKSAVGERLAQARARFVAEIRGDGSAPPRRRLKE